MKKRILFCGTPKFAIPSLQTLIKYQDTLNYNLMGVITIPDRVAGRGHNKQESPIKKEAKKHELKIFEPIKLSDPIFIKNIQNLNLDIILVVAFKKLPKILFNIPSIGTINLHASLLPEYRGAAPINWAIINGSKKTGLTTFFINEKIDTGDIILQHEIEIQKNWHAHHLYNELMNQSEYIIKLTIEKLFSTEYKTSRQEELINENNKYAPKINKQDLIIKWAHWNSKELIHIYNFMRGMSPPGVKMDILIKNNHQILKKKIIITEVGELQKRLIFQKNINIEVNQSDNTIILTKDDNFFLIKRIKLENGKELNATEFINGFLKKKNHINDLFVNSQDN